MHPRLRACRCPQCQSFRQRKPILRLLSCKAHPQLLLESCRHTGERQPGLFKPDDVDIVFSGSVRLENPHACERMHDGGVKYLFPSRLPQICLGILLFVLTSVARIRAMVFILMQSTCVSLPTPAIASLRKSFTIAIGHA